MTIAREKRSMSYVLQWEIYTYNLYTDVKNSANDTIEVMDGSISCLSFPPIFAHLLWHGFLQWNALVSQILVLPEAVNPLVSR